MELREDGGDGADVVAPLDDAPRNDRPLVQVIGSSARNHNLSLLFATRAGRGKMLVCSIDLPGHQDRPEVRRYLHGL